MDVLYEADENDRTFVEGQKNIKAELIPQGASVGQLVPDGFKFPSTHVSQISLPARFEFAKIQAGAATIETDSLLRIQPGATPTRYYAHVKTIFRDQDEDSYQLLVQRFTWRPEKYELLRLSDLPAMPLVVPDDASSRRGSASSREAKGGNARDDETEPALFGKKRASLLSKAKPDNLVFLELGSIEEEQALNNTWAPSSADEIKVTRLIRSIAIGAWSKTGGEVVDEYLGVSLQIKHKPPSGSKWRDVSRKTFFAYPKTYGSKKFYSFVIPGPTAKASSDEYMFREVGDYQLQAIGIDHTGDQVESAAVVIKLIHGDVSTVDAEWAAVHDPNKMFRLGMPLPAIRLIAKDDSRRPMIVPWEDAPAVACQIESSEPANKHPTDHFFANKSKVSQVDGNCALEISQLLELSRNATRLECVCQIGIQFTVPQGRYRSAGAHCPVPCPVPGTLYRA